MLINMHIYEIQQWLISMVLATLNTNVTDKFNCPECYDLWLEYSYEPVL